MHMDLTETRIDSTDLLHGKLLHAYRDTVRLPDGSTGIREWIDHPGAAAIVPVFYDETTILIRQYRYPSGREYIEVPAGKLDFPGENPEVAAKRELAEETGFSADVFTPLGAVHPCIGYSNEVVHLFLAEKLEPTVEHHVPGEFVEPFRISLREAVMKAFKGEIVDAKTVVALWRALQTIAQRS